MKTTWNGLRIKPIYQIFGVDDIAAAMIIGTIASVATAAVSGTANTISQVKTNKQNQQNLETAWSRDDAQLQRARADASAAGFSPLAALSNNLTNTSPGMLQAPQFDSSGIVSSLQQGTKDYANYKAQKPILEQQEESMRLANKEKSIDLRTRNLQNLANFAKTMKELDGMDLSNYEKASILVANGIPQSTVQTMLKHTTKKDVVKNSSQEYINLLQTAQTTLANEQATTQSNQRALLDAQTALAGIQKTAAENENDYMWNQKISIYVPVITNNKNGVKIDWDYSDSIPRKQAFDLIKNAIDTLAIKKAGQEVNSDTYNKIFDAIDKVLPF